MDAQQPIPAAASNIEVASEWTEHPREVSFLQCMSLPNCVIHLRMVLRYPRFCLMTYWELHATHTVKKEPCLERFLSLLPASLCTEKALSSRYE